MEHTRLLHDLKHCSIRRALDVLGDKWTLLVLREALYSLNRSDDFARSLGCGHGVLSARLKTLAKANILERREYKEADQRVRTEYHLTDKGRDLFPAILALAQWSERWMPPRKGPAERVLSRTGRPVAVVVTSDSTVRSLALRDVKITPGPGAKHLVKAHRRQHH